MDKTESPLEIFDKAQLSVTQERGKVYGHPADDFRKVALMGAMLEDCSDMLVKHALYMILVKIARLVQTPSHVDSVVDIAGYARTIAMIQTRRIEQEQPAPAPAPHTGYSGPDYTARVQAATAARSAFFYDDPIGMQTFGSLEGPLPRTMIIR